MSWLESAAVAVIVKVVADTVALGVPEIRQVEDATLKLSPAGRVGETVHDVAAAPELEKSKLEMAVPVTYVWFDWSATIGGFGLFTVMLTCAVSWLASLAVAITVKTVVETDALGVPEMRQVDETAVTVSPEGSDGEMEQVTAAAPELVKSKFVMADPVK